MYYFSLSFFFFLQKNAYETYIVFSSEHRMELFPSGPQLQLQRSPGQLGHLFEWPHGLFHKHHCGGQLHPHSLVGTVPRSLP